MTPPPRAGPNPDGKRAASTAASRGAARAAAKLRRKLAAPAKLVTTLLDFVRYAVSRFIEAKLVFAHGTTDPVAEAAFLVCETLHLHPDQFETFATARVTAREAKAILDVIERRITTRKPAAYLVNKIYMRGLPFYVDERVIVPRSFIGELLRFAFRRRGRRRRFADRRPARGRKRARPLHRLGLPGDSRQPALSRTRGSTRWIFRRTRSRSPRATSPTMACADRVTLYRGDLFAPLGGKRYDLIITNPPYVDARGHGGRCRANAAPSRSSPSTAAPTGSTSSGAS